MAAASSPKKKAMKPTKSMAMMQISEEMGSAKTEYEKEGCFSGCCSTPKGMYRLRMRGIVSELELPSSRKRQIDRNLLHAAGESQANALWSQSWGMRLNMIMLWFGIIVSALIVVQHSQQVDELELQDAIFWVLIIFSLLNNVATGTQQLFNFFDVAKTHEEAFAKMDTIAWSYFMNTGDFEGLSHEEGFSLFAKKIIDVKFEESENLRNAKNKGREAAEAAMKENEEKANKKLKTFERKKDDDGDDDDSDPVTPPPKKKRRRRKSRRMSQFDEDDDEGSFALPVDVGALAGGLGGLGKLMGSSRDGSKTPGAQAPGVASLLSAVTGVGDSKAGAGAGGSGVSSLLGAVAGSDPRAAAGLAALQAYNAMNAKPAEKPAEKAAETPAETPAEKAADDDASSVKDAAENEGDGSAADE